MPAYPSPRNKTQKVCAHCGGMLYWATDEQEWVCISCARRYTSNSDNHNGEGNLISATIEAAKAHKTIRISPATAEEPSRNVSQEALPLPQDSNTGAPPSQPKPTPREVPAKDWYAPSEISFHRKHMLFLLKHLILLREGVYPPDPYHSGYTDEPISKKKKRIRRTPSFATPALYTAEVEIRLERAGIDGLILEAIEAWGKSPASISAHLRIPEGLVKKKRDTALRYVSGWRRKKRTYKQFVNHKKG